MPTRETPPPNLPLGIAITALAYLFFAGASSLVYYFRERFPTIQIIFIQNFVSLLFILPLALKHGIKPLKTNNLPLHLARDFFGVGSYFLFFLAIRYLNLVDATTLNYSAPFFVPFIWRIWQDEIIESNVWWSIIIGFVGVAIILHPSKEILQLGFLFGLFAGISSAIAFTALRVLNIKREPARRTLFYYFSFGTLISFPFALVFWVQPNPEEWWLALMIGVATAVGQLLLTIAYRYGTASYLSPLGYLTVVYNGLIAYLVFSQHLGWHSLLGTVLIIAGGTLTYVFKRKPETILKTFEAPPDQRKPPL